MDVKGEVLLQLFNKRKLRNGTKTYLAQFFFSIYSQIKKIRVKVCLYRKRMQLGGVREEMV